MRSMTPEMRARHSEWSKRGGYTAAADAKALKAAGMKAAREWRESRRCHCGALGWQPCIHRPDGAG